ncbi:hypothetical protein FPV67DRAFT_1479792 [Lyophyllum atratum]|nr:hypothetical protein FPV67DRAFT_1479792 [Lyophyllum atratum]
MERKALLMADRWTENVEPTTVGCRGCGKTIKLERKGTCQYYGFNWKKHRGGCKKIKWLEEKEQEEGVTQ